MKTEEIMYWQYIHSEVYLRVSQLGKHLLADLPIEYLRSSWKLH